MAIIVIDVCNTLVFEGEMVELARKYGALLFGVEHRYYGKSVPVKGLKVENIHFLSSQQA